METLGIALLLKPLIGLVVFAAIVIPVEMALAKWIPDCRLKAVLFDRTFQKRRPWLFMFWWVLLVGGVFAVIGYFDPV